MQIKRRYIMILWFYQSIFTVKYTKVDINAWWRKFVIINLENLSVFHQKLCLRFSPILSVFTLFIKNELIESFFMACGRAILNHIVGEPEKMMAVELQKIMCNKTILSINNRFNTMNTSQCYRISFNFYVALKLSTCSHCCSHTN